MENMNNTETSIVPADRAVDLDPMETIAHESWWNELSGAEQDTLRDSSFNLLHARQSYVESKLAMGKALFTVQKILEPRGWFGAYLIPFKFSIRTAYRRIALYRNAAQFISDVILYEAINMGIEIAGDSEDAPLGPYTEAAKTNPPPEHPTPEAAREWLYKVESSTRMPKKHPVKEISQMPALNVGELTKAAYRSLRRPISQLRKENQMEFLIQVGGMIMTEFEASGKLILKPVEIPDGWERKRGKPKRAA
jgi:hypothetical protein